MNIDNGTTQDLAIGREVTISVRATITEIGRNYIEVELDDGDDLTISEGSSWFIQI